MRFDYTQRNIEYVMNLIRDNLTPDLLKSKFRKINESNPLYGHCKHASQALVLLIDTNCLRLTKNHCHVWVQDIEKIYDVTADQYYSQGLNPCYDNPVYFDCVHTQKVDLLIERVWRTHLKLSTSPLDPPQPAL